VKDALDYGPRLTDDEYERRIIALHRGLPPLPTRAQDEEIRRRELELAIDHRLGRDFPRERREALWAARQRVEKKRLRFAAAHLLRRLFGRRSARDGERLAQGLMGEYAKVLSAAELERFLGVPRADADRLER